MPAKEYRANEDYNPEPAQREIQRLGGWFLGLGVVLAVLGAIAVVAAFAATLATVFLFGVLLLIAGMFQAVQAFLAARWKGFFWHLLLGLLYALLGAILLADPVEGAIGLTLLLAAFFVVGGVLRIVLAVQRRGQVQTGWFLFGGILDLLLGLLIWIGWPATGMWVIGLFLGIELLFAGLSLIMVGLAMPRSGEVMGP